MADNSIVYKILVDDSSGTATIRNLKGQIVATQIPVKELRKEFGNFAKEVEKVRFNKFSKQLKNTSKASSDFQRASGGATSAVLELGRVVQDAPYGLRGMANNITQLASQMAFATKSAGSFGGALKQMGKAMLGPLGVVFAISAVVSIMEGMEGKSKKAKKAIDSLNETFGEEATKLMVLKDALNDSNISLETKKELVSKANKEFKDLNISISDIGELSEESAEKIDLLSMSFIKNAKARAIAKLIQDEMVEQSKIEARTAGENLKWYETAYYALINSIGGAGAGMADALKADSENQEEALKTSKDTIKRYIDMLKKNDGELAKFLFGGKKGKKGKAKKKSEAEILYDLYGIDTSDEARDKYLDKLSSMFDFGDDLKKQYEEELRGLNLAKQIGAITEEQYNDYLSKMKERFSEDHVITGVAPKLDFKLSPETQASIDAYNKMVSDMMIKKAELNDWSGYAETFSKGLSAVSGFIDAQFDAQLVTEQNKTNALNEELNNRLLNENLSVKERKSIQNEIARNDEELRKKQNETKKKAFNTQKAFNIAMAVADTSSATMKAYASQLIPGDPTSIIRAKIAAGLAATFGALQIATIASQKFQPEAASTPIRTASGGAGGGGVGNRSFDFNLVGSSQGNQVAEAVQGQFDKPIKAYVVSKDITNQQQLDANTKSSARFGG